MGKLFQGSAKVNQARREYSKTAVVPNVILRNYMKCSCSAFAFLLHPFFGSNAKQMNQFLQVKFI